MGFGAKKIDKSSINYDTETCDTADSYFAFTKSFDVAREVFVDGCYYISEPLKFKGKTLRGVHRDLATIVSKGKVITKDTNYNSHQKVYDIFLVSLSDIAVDFSNDSDENTNVYICEYKNMFIYGKHGCVRGTKEYGNQGNVYQTTFENIGLGCKDPDGFGFKNTRESTRLRFKGIYDIWGNDFSFKGKYIFYNCGGHFDNCNLSFTYVPFVWYSDVDYIYANFNDCNFEAFSQSAIVGKNSYISLKDCSILINSNETYYRVFQGTFTKLLLDNSNPVLLGTSTEEDVNSRVYGSTGILNGTSYIANRSSTNFSSPVVVKMSGVVTELQNLDRQMGVMDRWCNPLLSQSSTNTWVDDRNVRLYRTGAKTLDGDDVVFRIKTTENTGRIFGFVELVSCSSVATTFGKLLFAWTPGRDMVESKEDYVQLGDYSQNKIAFKFKLVKNGSDTELHFVKIWTKDGDAIEKTTGVTVSWNLNASVLYPSLETEKLAMLEESNLLVEYAEK